jgi:hypothetical protein
MKEFIVVAVSYLADPKVKVKPYNNMVYYLLNNLVFLIPFFIKKLLGTPYFKFESQTPYL